MRGSCGVGPCCGAGCAGGSTAWVAVVTLLFAAVIFVAVYRGTGYATAPPDRPWAGGRRGRVLSQPEAPGRGLTPRSGSGCDRYINDQPFGASSTLLFAIIPGAGTSTNQPELLGNTGARQRREPPSRTRRIASPTACSASTPGYSTVDLPDVGDLRLLKRRSRTCTRDCASRSEPESRWAVCTSPARHRRKPSSWPERWRSPPRCWPAYLVGARVSLPLRRMAAVAARVDAGDLEPRIHETAAPATRCKRPRRRVQPHARPALRRVRRPARVRRRRLARAAHAADCDPRASSKCSRPSGDTRARRSGASSASCRPRSRGSAAWSTTCCCWPSPKQAEFLRVELDRPAPATSRSCGTA